MENRNHLDINAYLKSGILELYALDMLGASELAGVDFLLSFQLELGEELERIYVGLENEADRLHMDFSSYINQQVTQRTKDMELAHKMEMAALPVTIWFSDQRIA